MQHTPINFSVGAVAGWVLHPLENAAFHGAHPRRSPDEAAPDLKADVHWSRADGILGSNNRIDRSRTSS
jgi:hypothetical protein